MPSTPNEGRALRATLKKLLMSDKGDRLKLGDKGPGPGLFALT